jgi:hypothetical protein
LLSRRFLHATDHVKSMADEGLISLLYPEILNRGRSQVGACLEDGWLEIDRLALAE